MVCDLNNKEYCNVFNEPTAPIYVIEGVAGNSEFLFAEPCKLTNFYYFFY